MNQDSIVRLEAPLRMGLSVPLGMMIIIKLCVLFRYSNTPDILNCLCIFTVVSVSWAEALLLYVRSARTVHWALQLLLHVQSAPMARWGVCVMPLALDCAVRAHTVPWDPPFRRLVRSRMNAT